MTLALAFVAASRCGSGPRIDREPNAGRILPLNPALFTVFRPTAEVERLATGFELPEGPAWIPGLEGFLVLSDVLARRVYRWDSLGVHASPAPFFRSPPPDGFGPNGLEADSEGGLIVCDQAGRRVLRVDRDGRWTVLVDRFRGKRLNSPNDLVLATDGSLYFTDPPYGLGREDGGGAKELDFNGVFRFSPNGGLERLEVDLPRPNGIALSPDERILYVANSEAGRPVIVMLPLTREDAEPRVLAAFDSLEAGDGVDGLAVDHRGNVYAATTSGVWILDPEGRRLGSIQLPEAARGLTWAGAGTALYITAGTGLYRVLPSGRRAGLPPIGPSAVTQ